jgi:hypothetical protein
MGKAGALKVSTFCSLFFEKTMFQFESSAIENISDVADNTVEITFVGGRRYQYTVANVDLFVSDLSSVIAENKSVGRFINQQLKSESLVLAA